MPSPWSRHLRGTAAILLVSAPLLAGLTGAGFATAYVKAGVQTTGRVPLTVLVGHQTAYDLAPYVADFNRLFQSDETVSAASKAAGGSGRDLHSTTDSNSSVVVVSYAAGSSSRSLAGLQAGVRVAAQGLLRQENDRAIIEQQAAIARQRSATQTLDRVRSEIGPAAVVDVVEQKHADLDQLRKSLSTTPPGAPRTQVQNAIDQAQTVLTNLDLLLADDSSARATLAEAADSRSGAERRLTLNDAVRVVVQSRDMATIDSVRTLPKIMTILATAVSAAAAGLVAAIAVLLFLSARRAWRHDPEDPRGGATLGWSQAAGEEAGPSVRHDREALV
jgi:hypothetical protein